MTMPTLTAVYATAAPASVLVTFDGFVREDRYQLRGEVLDADGLVSAAFVTIGQAVTCLLDDPGTYTVVARVQDTTDASVGADVTSAPVVVT